MKLRRLTEMNYKDIQNIAKEAIRYIKSQIIPGMTLMQVRELCEQKLLELGADSFWYWNIGAFCFAGEDTTISISGKRYQTADRIIEEDDIITLDLSPQVNNMWGDYARTIIIQEGKVIQSIDQIRNQEWKNGLLMEEKLHQEMVQFVNENTTFEELYFYMNNFIMQNHYVNLDFAGNLGHSIEKQQDKRIYIEKGNTLKLSEVTMFTFEPHIALKNSKYGYKKEDIYYFDNNKLKKL